jgi:hypothetical protein
MLLAVAVWPAAACNSNTTSPTTTTSTSTTTETFTGSLGLNGAVTHTFAIAGAGSVTATLTSIGTSTAVGLLLGSYTALTNTCAVAVSNDLAVQSSVVTASASAATSACVRIYDSTGLLTDTVAYTITVVHP